MYADIIIKMSEHIKKGIHKGSIRQGQGVSRNDVKGNVSVVCRFRPMNSTERQLNTETCVSFNSDRKSVKISEVTTKLKDFEFDYVFDTESTQEQVYEIAAMPIIQSVLAGFNGTVLAYGQTSSGKTFTMTGSDIKDSYSKGVAPRMINTIFSHIQNSQNHIELQSR